MSALPGHDRADPVLRRIADQIVDQQAALAGSSEIPESVQTFVEGLADQVAALPIGARLQGDPYVLVRLQRSLIGALRVFKNTDRSLARRELYVRLWQLRIYSDLAEGRRVYEDRPAKELVQWLTDVLEVSQATLAELFDVSTRTFARWCSEADAGAPRGAHARRVRIVASVVGHLRYALTSRGAIDWMQRPHPEIGGRAPRELLDRPDALGVLTCLAAQARGIAPCA